MNKASSNVVLHSQNASVLSYCTHGPPYFDRHYRPLKGQLLLYLDLIGLQEQIIEAKVKDHSGKRLKRKAWLLRGSKS